ncbi:hypothetical protein [Helicobacter suis]|nr:hypothetical protein [Helicobacter suis]
MAREQNSGYVIKDIDTELEQVIDLLIEFDRLIRRVSLNQTNIQLSTKAS